MGVFEKLNNLADSLYTKTEEFVDYMKAAYYGYNLKQHTFGGEALAGVCAFSVGVPILTLAYQTGGPFTYIVGGAAMAFGIVSIIDDVVFNKGLCFYTIGVPKDVYTEVRKKFM
jgi:hypothetical protein